MKASIVLGLGYGDEGKGVTTDFLCSRLSNPIVVRFSGGQQVGHTVVHNGIKHIHSNFGSGSLRGVPTYYSEHTTFYPATIARELKILKEKGVNPNIIFHPLAKLTTPFDVFENRRDVNNLSHGTCGLGIGKTMKRNEGPFKLHAIDLLNPIILKQKLESIRLNLYNFKFITNYSGLSEEIEDFMEAIQEISWKISDYSFLKDYKNLIFEGSQGILLDMDHGVFPNVTYSNTTSKNAHEILDKLKVKKRTMYYVTRCYSTRHGFGPFNDEKLELVNNEGEINVFNEYQKEFKTAKLDYDLLKHALSLDRIYSEGKMTDKKLVVTCLDQLPSFKLHDIEIAHYFSKIYGSFSPDSKDFRNHYDN